MLTLRLDSTNITLNGRERIHDKYICAHMHTHRHTHFQFKATFAVKRSKKIDWIRHLWWIPLEISANHLQQSWMNDPNIFHFICGYLTLSLFDVYVSVCVCMRITHCKCRTFHIHCNIFKWINLIALLEMQLHGNFQFKLCNIVFLTECLPFFPSHFHL